MLPKAQIIRLPNATATLSNIRKTCACYNVWKIVYLVRAVGVEHVAFWYRQTAICSTPNHGQYSGRKATATLSRKNCPQKGQNLLLCAVRVEHVAFWHCQTAICSTPNHENRALQIMLYFLPKCYASILRF